MLLLGPALDAVSGVSSHLNMLLESTLSGNFELRHFQVGSEGRSESPWTRWSRLLTDPWRLVRQVRDDNIDVVHINSSLNARAYWRDILFVMAARLCRTRVLFQVHGGALPQRFFRGNAVLNAWLRLSLRLPDHVVVLGNDEADAWHRFLPGQSISTIPNAIDCQPYQSLDVREASAGRPLRLVYLGRLADGKGLCELLHGLAAPSLRNNRPRLRVAGSGPERRHLQDLVRDLGLQSHVEFVGAVFGDAKRRLLADSDVFVLPSYSEGLPYALLEAMAAGTAVITTPVGAIPDTVECGVHGLYIPPRDSMAIADALRELQQSPERLQAMREACRARAMGHYDIKRLEDDFRELYRSMTSTTDVRRWAEA